MRFMSLLFGLCLVILAGCEQLSGHQDVQTAIRAFCAASDADLLSFLDTAPKKHYATQLCRALGWQLGTPTPLIDPLAAMP